MKILYITYIDFGDMSSGSSVRPQKIYDAFLQQGHEIKLVSTQQNRYRERSRVVCEAIKWVKKNEFDACYVESPSGPIFNYLDICLLKAVAKKGRPIHLFYRDAFWLFAKDFLQERTKDSLKVKLIELMQKRDMRIYKKTVSLLYMPTDSCLRELAKHYSFSKVKALPPGGDRVIKENYQTTNIGIYVGGATTPYGVDLLINAYEILNQNAEQFKLIVVTRKGELMNEEELLSNYRWLQIYHKAGREELEPLYSQADVAFLPQRKSLYLDIAFCVKTFEYISYGLPVIVNNLEEMRQFVEKNQFGYYYNETVESLVECIRKFYNEGKQIQLHENAIITCEKNLWTSRTNEIVRDFEEELNQKI